MEYHIFIHLLCSFAEDEEIQQERKELLTKLHKMRYDDNNVPGITNCMVICYLLTSEEETSYKAQVKRVRILVLVLWFIMRVVARRARKSV